MMTRQNTSHKTLYLTVDQIRAIDQYAIEKLGIPGVILMENAGRNCADHVEKMLKNKAGSGRRKNKASIICGRGNNGGDGFTIARHLAHRGWEVNVDLYGDPDRLSGDAAVNHAIVENMGLPVRNLKSKQAIAAATRRWSGADVIVDALLGTGFSGEVREPMATLINKLNNQQKPLIMAVDVPSGLNATTGEPGGVAVKANRTVSFVAAKTGYKEKTAKPYLGRVYVVDIGAPTELILPHI
jgi:NAD(P)H-hydrate epimerase